MAVKKAYQNVVSFLESNSNSKVSTILADVIEMCSAKQAGGGTATTVRRDDAGVVTHVFCYYHKMWEPVAEVEFGAKANSATGLNNMCKEGTSQWTKQQRAAKKSNEELLALVAAGDVAPTEIGAHQETIEEQRGQIVPREDGIGSAE